MVSGRLQVDDLILIRQSPQAANISRMIVEEWRQIPDDERRVWEDLARADKQRYTSEMIRFEAAIRDRADDNAVPSAGKPPKKPMSAFFEFARTRRAELRQLHGNCSNAQVSKLLSAEWHALPKEERQRFLDIYSRNLITYREQMKPYRKNRTALSVQAPG